MARTSTRATGRKRVAILISGRGSNMGALIRAACEPDYPARIALVVSSRAKAPGLQLASEFDIPTAVVRGRDHDSREAYDAALHALLEENDIELVCLAGFMRLLTPGFVKAWQGRMINIHPSLLPAFKGLDTHQRAITNGVKLHGCTVHFVTEEMDDGPIIIQAAVPVVDEDTPETLAARVLEREHEIYPQALEWLARGLLRASGGRTFLKRKATARGSLLAPQVQADDDTR